MHSCCVHSFDEYENFQNMFNDQKVFPGNFVDFFLKLIPFSLEQTLSIRGSYQYFHELKIFYFSSIDTKTFLGFFLYFLESVEYIWAKAHLISEPPRPPGPCCTVWVITF